MKSNVISIIALLVACAAVVVANFQKVPRVAYAETSVIMSQFSEAIKARKQFEELQKGWDKNLKLINDSLVANMNKLKTEYEAASKEDKDAMRAGLDKWNNDYNRYSQAVKKMAQEKDQELMTPVINKVNSYLKVWGESQGYDMIFGTMTGGNILQANTAYNVTSDLLVDLNQHYKDLPPEEAKEEPAAVGQKEAPAAAPAQAEAPAQPAAAPAAQAKPAAPAAKPETPVAAAGN